MKMKRGELVGFNGCLGYDYDPKEKVITINKKEAEIVKYIFQRYTEGNGCYVIAKELTALKYRTKRGSTNWGESTVRGIIKNEKYNTGTKKGKRYCEHFKSISEQALEAAFVDAFNTMCTNNKDVVIEFVKTVEESISKSNLTNKIKKISLVSLWN
ncbi:recombinase family protein [Maledivibacter halophilus]|nr:recombinase family protein [Maledivibacter halophilus]